MERIASVQQQTEVNTRMLDTVIRQMSGNVETGGELPEGVSFPLEDMEALRDLESILADKAKLKSLVCICC